MNSQYRKLMRQYGGEIPFSVLAKQVSKNKQKRVNKRTKRIKRTRRNISTKYSVGTILRKRGVLYKLNASKQWIKI